MQSTVLNSEAAANLQPAAPTWSKPADTTVVAGKITPPKRTLWRIEEDMIALEELLEESGGDITACEAAFEQFSTELAGDFKRKADGYAAYVAELTARAEKRKEESDRLLKRSKMDSTLAGFLKNRLKETMQNLGQKKFETDRYKLSVCNNGGAIPLIIKDDFILQPEKLPEPFRVEVKTYKPNTEKIREELATGGTLTFASLGERGTHLRIS